MTALALDCEMVGVKEESQYTTVHIRSGENSFLARVSIVNENGVCIYDKFVKPNQPVTNYRSIIFRACDFSSSQSHIIYLTPRQFDTILKIYIELRQVMTLFLNLSSN